MPDNNTFLDAVAQRYAGLATFEDTLFLLPNRRSIVFLERALQRAGESRAPKAKTLEALYGETAGRRPSRRMLSLSTLYAAWKQVCPGREYPFDGTSFEAFLTWGETLLKDIDTLERHGIDAASYPRALTEAVTNESQSQKFAQRLAEGHAETLRQQALWELLPAVQAAFAALMASQGRATGGQMRHQALANAKAGLWPESVTAAVELVLVDPGIPGPCETQIWSALQKAKATTFLWDYAGEAVTDRESPAARHYEESVRRFPSPLQFHAPALPMKEQSWHVVHVPSITGQARAAAAALAANKAATEDTVLILPDDTILMPVLDAVPEAIDAINVTMGYPLHTTAAAQLPLLAEALLRSRKADGAHVTYGHRQVRDLLTHPLVAAATEGLSLQEEDRIRKAGRNRISDRAVKEAHAVLDAILDDDLADDTAAWMQKAAEALAGKASPIERETLRHMAAIAKDLQATLPQDETRDAITWLRLLGHCLRGETLPFEGEPLQGLQVMGPMETRCLDFGTDIWLSATDGILPKSPARDTLLPEPLRRTMGLEDRTPQHEAEHAFWRTCCRAKDIWLIHDCRTEGLQKGEITRYARELKLLYGVDLQEATVTEEITPEALSTPAKAIVKTPEVMKELDDLLVNGKGTFSATSINTYLDCRLRYYYAYVRGIRRTEDIVDNLDAALFGTIYHGVMETLYKDHAGETLSAAQILALGGRDRLAALCERSFADAGVPVVEGGNAILRDVIVTMVEHTLEADSRLAPLTILGAEADRDLKVTLPVSGKTVRLYGKIDRLDRPLGRRIRVVDYKSGSVKGSDDTTNPIASLHRDDKKRPHIALQLYLYALLCKDGEGIPDTCIYAMRDIFDHDPRSATIDQWHLERFEEGLKGVLDEVFNPDVPFDAQQTDPERCRLCDFKNICNK